MDVDRNVIFILETFSDWERSLEKKKIIIFFNLHKNLKTNKNTLKKSLKAGFKNLNICNSVLFYY